jgi:hypothetical protein
MMNEQLSWLTPFSQQVAPGLAWRSRVPQMQGVGRADGLLYFKCPATKQMRCPVNAYLTFSSALSNYTGNYDFGMI